MTSNREDEGLYVCQSVDSRLWYVGLHGSATLIGPFYTRDAAAAEIDKLEAAKRG